MWNVKPKGVLVIRGATGTISKSLRQYPSKIPGKHEIELKNNRVGHCTHTAESADAKVHNIIHTRSNITCSTNCKYRTAAIQYTLEKWFISGVKL